MSRNFLLHTWNKKTVESGIVHASLKTLNGNKKWEIVVQNILCFCRYFTNVKLSHASSRLYLLKYALDFTFHNSGWFRNSSVSSCHFVCPTCASFRHFYGTNSVQTKLQLSWNAIEPTAHACFSLHCMRFHHTRSSMLQSIHLIWLCSCSASFNSMWINH